MLLVYLGSSIIAYTLYAFMARCPRCRMPLLLRPRKLFGVEVFTWSLMPPEHCRHCNAAL